MKSWHVMAAAIVLLASFSSFAAAPVRPTIGVMRLEGSNGVEASVIDFCTEALAQNLALSGQFRVMDWRRMERSIAAIMEKNPNFSQEDAAMQAIEEMGLNGLFRGSLRPMGDTTYVRVWMTDEAGAIVKAAQATYSDKGEIEDAIREVSQSLAGAAPSGPGASPATTGTPSAPGAKSRLAIRPPQDPSALTDHMRFVNNRLTSELVNSDRYGVIAWAEVEGTVSQTAEDQPRLSPGEARARALQRLGVEWVIETSMARIGDQFHLTARILNRNLSVSRIAEETAKNEGELDNAVKELALKIVLSPQEYSELLEKRKEDARTATQRQRERDAQQRERQRQQEAQRQSFTNSIGMEFRLIPAGQFIMGSNEGDADELPIRVVNINRAYYMGVHPVTQGQFEQVMRTNPSYFKGEDRPVERVSWHDAQEFCLRLSVMDRQANYRLPTEAEWEYAARAGSQTRYFWGDEFAEDYAWYEGNSGNTTRNVGSLTPNEWGLHDMSGNVWEWVQDWYRDSYDGAATRNPTGPGSGRARVLRGGSWVNQSDFLRSSKRRPSHPNYKHAVIGFRVVAER